MESPSTNRTALVQNWHEIDWRLANDKVLKLQQLILEAFRMEKMSEVKRLQNDLTRSFSARALAVRRVTSNAGKNTPGPDDVLW